MIGFLASVWQILSIYCEHLLQRIIKWMSQLTKETTNLSQIEAYHSWNPSFIKGGWWDLPKIESLGKGGGVFEIFCWKGGINLKSGVDLEIMGGGLSLFLLLYSLITFTLYVGKVEFPLLLFFLRSFELAMQDFHPRLYSTKTL